MTDKNKLIKDLLTNYMPAIVLLIIGIIFIVKSGSNTDQQIQQINENIVNINNSIGIQQSTGEVENIYNFWSGQQSVVLISGTDFRLKGGITDRLDKQYPSIILKSGNIEKGILRVIVDFTPEFIKYNPGIVYSYKIGKNGERIPSTNYVMVLKFGFGKVTNGNPQFGGRFDVINYAIYPDNKYANDLDNGLNGAFLGKDIVGGREYLIPLDKVFVGNANRYSENDKTYEEIFPIDFLKKNKDKEIPISLRFSSAGMRGTVIKHMEIIYVGDENIIEAVKSYQ